MTTAAAPAWRFDRLSEPAAELGESPVWSPAENAVWWIDIPNGRLLRTDAESGATEAWTAPEQIGCATVSESGQVLAALTTGVFLFDRASGGFAKFADPAERADVRFNEGGVDPSGRWWIASMDLENKRPIGAFFRLEPDGSSTRMLDGFITPNGLAFDAARGRVYVADSHPSVQTIWVCGYDAVSGALSERRVFADLRDLPGRPDGSALDVDGNYWIAGVDGGAILGYRPDGALFAEIPTPMPHPTKIAFGGGDRRSVFLTSKRSGAPGAGALHRARGGIVGAAPPLARPFEL